LYFDGFWIGKKQHGRAFQFIISVCADIIGKKLGLVK
jgi:hypothetical protein